MKIKNLIIVCTVLVFGLSTSAFRNPEPAFPTIEHTTKASFAEFLSHFERVELPFAMGLEDMQKQRDLHASQNLQKKVKKSRRPSSTKRVVRDYLQGGGVGLYSRMGPPEILPIARFYPNDKMIAVVYKAVRPFTSRYNAHYELALFDLSGNRLPKADAKLDWGFYFPLAEQGIHQTETFSIDRRGNIWKKTYQHEWAKDVKKKGFHDNEVTAYALANTQVFEIGSNGKLVELKEYPLSDRASLD